MSDSPPKPRAIGPPLVGESDLHLGTDDYTRLKRDVGEAYERAAENYDQVGTRRFRHFGREIVKRLELPAEANVLDVGTGRGAILFPLAEHLTAGRAVGVDLALRMAVRSSAEARLSGLPRVSLMQMDADHLAFRADTFDAVTCGFALFFFDFENVLAGLYEVLKPGGALAVSVNHSPADPDNYERWKWMLPLLRDVVGSDFKPPPACVAPVRLAAPERLRTVLEDAGFADIRLEAVQATLYFKDEHDWWEHELSQGSRMWSDGMTDQAREEYRDRAFAHLREMKDDKGIRVVDGAMLAFANKPADKSANRSV